MRKQVAIIGAGAAGLMAAEVLSGYDVDVSVYDQKPTAARKILMAGKTGLNISHNEPIEQFIMRYTPSEWIAPFVRSFGADDIRAWMVSLGIESYVGSTGRIFPVEMKASKLVRAWLNRLNDYQVKFHYRYRATLLHDRHIAFEVMDNKGVVLEQFTKQFDAVIVACGGGSYAALGSDSAWQAWFDPSELSSLYASNVGVLRDWSAFMADHFGQPLKRVTAWVNTDHRHQGDIIISHYGLESELIYRLNSDMRAAQLADGFILFLDLLPDKSSDDILKIFHKNKKQSLNTLLKKCGLDAVKIALLRECTNKTDWSDLNKMANYIKQLAIHCTGFRPMDEAISTGGGIKRTAVGDDLQLKSCAGVFCCGEMLDWDAPTGGYLLTACFATGRAAGQGVVDFLGLNHK